MRNRGWYEAKIGFDDEGRLVLNVNGIPQDVVAAVDGAVSGECAYVLGPNPTIKGCPPLTKCGPASTSS